MHGCDKSYTHPSSLRKHMKMHELNGDIEVLSQLNSDLCSQTSSLQSSEDFSKGSKSILPADVYQKCNPNTSPSEFSSSSSSLAISSPPPSIDDVYPTSSGTSNTYSYEGVNPVDEHYSKFMAEIACQKQFSQLISETENFGVSATAEPSCNRFMTYQNGYAMQNSRSFSFFNSIPPTPEHPMHENPTMLPQRHISMENNPICRAIKNTSGMF